jgi:very-short-patch-repair endonuclease
MGRKTSSIERIVAKELRQRHLLYDEYLQFGRFTPDLLVGQTIIEVDGDYWHTLPGIPEKDARKDAFYRDNGFNVIHIWEHEVNAGDFSKLDALIA